MSQGEVLWTLKRLVLAKVKHGSFKLHYQPTHLSRERLSYAYSNFESSAAQKSIMPHLIPTCSRLPMFYSWGLTGE